MATDSVHAGAGGAAATRAPAVATAAPAAEPAGPSWTTAATKWLPRISLWDTVRDYNKDNKGAERISGDLSAGVVVAGTCGAGRERARGRVCGAGRS